MEWSCADATVMFYEDVRKTSEKSASSYVGLTKARRYIPSEQVLAFVEARLGSNDGPIHLGGGAVRDRIRNLFDTISHPVVDAENVFHSRQQVNEACI
jgi:hypothetical protein